ncbi:hypothetical protein ACFQ3W_07970 [Paenibacillus puldeungensis]|uniref:Uncharacterized protein n=1 Tax=Paenibacillus puldeungensis TaxID=696536 RepID=A0ABW3RUT2_9BACL
MKKQLFAFWIIALLAVVGIMDNLFVNGNWINIIVPVAVVGIVFLLYKYPPAKYRKQHPKVKPSARTMAKVSAERRSTGGEKRKHYPFQVIDGQKGKNEDDLPKYH